MSWTDAERVAHMVEAIEEVVYRWRVLEHAKTLPDQGQALTDLGNAMHDLKTWHPGYDYETGTMPWERADEESAE